MTDTVIDTESPVDLLHQINANYYLSLIAFAILYYDYALTFSDEVRFVWSRRTSSVARLFFVNRYVSILGSIPIVLQSFASWSQNGCDNLQKYHQFFSITVQIIVSIIVILRTYALYELNRTVAITMGTVAFICICFAVWAVVGDSPTVFEPYDLSSMPGCHPLISRGLGVKLSGAWGSLLVFDTVVVILTLRKAIIIRKLENNRLFHVLIRDGTVYYSFFALINLAQIISFLVGAPLIGGLFTTFANVISTTLISRLMLNLQNPRLFSDSSGGRTMISTLGAFVARPNEHGTRLSGSTTEGTWTDDGAEYTTWDEDAIGSLHGTRATELIGLQQDIELSPMYRSDQRDSKL